GQGERRSDRQDRPAQARLHRVGYAQETLREDHAPRARSHLESPGCRRRDDAGEPRCGRADPRNGSGQGHAGDAGSLAGGHREVWTGRIGRGRLWRLVEDGGGCTADVPTSPNLHQPPQTSTNLPNLLQFHSSTCAPTSNTWSAGILKKAVARRALRDMKANSSARQWRMPGRSEATSVSRPRKNVVPAMAISSDFT